MHNPQGGRLIAAIFRALLQVRVNCNALAAEPGAYLQAVYWRICGKKLRARHRFSALKGMTPHAYALWRVTRERQQVVANAASWDLGTPIVVVVDCRRSAKDVDRTVASISGLARGKVHIVLLGAAASEGQCVTHMASIHELGGWLRAFGQRTEQDAPWVIAMAAGDQLSTFALPIYAQARRRTPQAQLFYADDDLIGPDGRRSNPYFKPRWNPELFKHHDYIRDSCLFACDPDKVTADWPRSALPIDGMPVHIPHVLHHRQCRPLPQRPSFPSLSENLPHVSVVVPTRNAVDLMRVCMEGLAKTQYPSFDVTVIDNDSDDPEALSFLEELGTSGVRIEHSPGVFNYAAMHNKVVPMLAGPLVCLLNNDIEITDPDWLRIMAAQCQRDEVGAVGAKLLYPDGAIQHAGIVTGVGGGAGHAHRMQPANSEGYFDRANLPQFISAVTAACLVVRKDRFEAVGGFDSENFAVAFNDVDLCLKLNARGWQSFYEPRACLVHHESKSRGLDKAGPQKARFDGELAALKRIWATDRGNDPYHHPELSQFGERFVVRL